MHPTCFWFDRWKPLCYCVRNGESYPCISAIRHLAIKGVAKSFLKSKFSEWYSKKIAKAFDKGQDIHEIKVNTTLSIMKPIHAQWIVRLYDCLRNDVELTRKSFKEAGITIEEEIEPIDPFKNLD